MKKIFLQALICTLFVSQIKAQSNQRTKALQSLIDAELRFAELGRTANMKVAFLQNLAPTGIKFYKGEPVIGLRIFDTLPAPPDYVLWEPIFADISGNEDLGYTTGPSMGYRQKSDTVPAGRGYYATVWEKRPDGQWKIMLDMGMGFKEPEPVKPQLYTSRILLTKKKEVPHEPALAEFLSFDQAYIIKLNALKRSYITDYLSEEVRVQHPREHPFVGIQAVARINEANLAFEFQQLGGGIAKSGDLGYTYGYAKVEVPGNGKPQVVKRLFLRVWKKEDGKNWKVVLDVIGA